MRKLLRFIKQKILKTLIRIFYPQCSWCATWNPQAISKYIVWQKILNVNGTRHIDWPVHFTSMISGDITVGNMVAPGYAPGCYINGMNGIDFGDNVFIGPGTKIISANHDYYDYSRHVVSPRIRIGSNVWLGANVIILPGVSIGDNTIVGAGSVVTKSLPMNVIAAGNPARVIRHKDAKQ